MHFKCVIMCFVDARGKSQMKPKFLFRLDFLSPKLPLLYCQLNIQLSEKAIAKYRQVFTTLNFKLFNQI